MNAIELHFSNLTYRVLLGSMFFELYQEASAFMVPGCHARLKCVSLSTQNIHNIKFIYKNNCNICGHHRDTDLFHITL
jgi:hypothetical protein